MHSQDLRLTRGTATLESPIYFLSSEGANNIALALFSFPSLALYEEYRSKSVEDSECQTAFSYAKETGCILSFERSFFRPVFD